MPCVTEIKYRYGSLTLAFSLPYWHDCCGHKCFQVPLSVEKKYLLTVCIALVPVIRDLNQYVRCNITMEQNFGPGPQSGVNKYYGQICVACLGFRMHFLTWYLSQVLTERKRLILCWSFFLAYSGISIKTDGKFFYVVSCCMQWVGSSVCFY